MNGYLDAAWRTALTLALFALAAALLVSWTWLETKDRINEQKRVAQARALLEIIPPSAHDNPLLDDVVRLDDAGGLGYGDTVNAFAARLNGEIVALIVPVRTTHGYSGPIELIVGVWRDGRIAGVRVLRHRETPGLGDKIESGKSNWIRGFDDRSLSNPLPTGWAVNKDDGEFDQLTGATITPRAVVGAVRSVLEYLATHRRGFGEAAKDGAT